MKIDGTLKPASSALANETRARPRAEPARTDQTDDQVALSPLSTTLAKAEAALSATPAVDKARVAEIRQAISEGRFKIDANRIADGLIESVREMLDTRTPQP